MNNDIENLLQGILKSFKFEYAYVLNEDKELYLIIKREESFSITNWDYLEEVIKNILDVENLFIISYLELKNNIFENYILSNAILIKKENNDE